MDIIARVRYWGSHCAEYPVHVSGGRSLYYHDLDLYSDTLAAYLSTLQPDNHAPVLVIGIKNLKCWWLSWQQ